MLKQLFSVLLLTAATLPALAQTAAVASPAAGYYQYCNLLGSGARSRYAELDYGQYARNRDTDLDGVYNISKPTAASQNAELEALNVLVKKLDSPVLALTYLTNHGWEYLGTTSLPSGFVMYILRRHLP